MKRGIYLVANQNSQEMCENLIFSIRNTGCALPIRIIHFGGKAITAEYILKEATLVHFEDFDLEAKAFIRNMRSVLTDCPLGYLYRYLAWFSDWDEFVYSDNDVVALCNWEILFDHLDGYDLLHADEEYTTNGVFNYNKPELVKKIFGDQALASAITAGHIVIRKNAKMIQDFNEALDWFKANPDIPQKHDQSLLHVASLLGNWKIMNLCKWRNWLSSWAGDYRNSLALIQKIQAKNAKISHIHYSGGTPNGELAIQDLLLSKQDDDGRMKLIVKNIVGHYSGYNRFKHLHKRGKRFLKRVMLVAGWRLILPS
jgi:hypothetical protein